MIGKSTPRSFTFVVMTTSGRNFRLSPGPMGGIFRLWELPPMPDEGQ